MLPKITLYIFLGEGCDFIEVEGGSSQTNGIYDYYDEFVWKKYGEDRFIFNKGDSNGWKIGTEGQSLYGTSYYFKSEDLSKIHQMHVEQKFGILLPTLF